MFSLTDFLRLILLSGLLLSGCKSSVMDLPEPRIDLAELRNESAVDVWPVIPLLSEPDSLRPCCAFGYDLKVNLFSIPIPFYKVDNVIDSEKLGQHRYNDGFFTGIANLTGLGSEELGIIYTTKGGFIDIAHVRDTADNTLFLFTEIYKYLGEEKTLVLKTELFERRIQLKPFSAPVDPIERYTLAVYLSGYLAYQLAAWHEVAQWYGYTSVPGFSEKISAFSVEDLYSNLLGSRLAMALILQGNAITLEMYNLSMDKILSNALNQLGAVEPDKTRSYFDRVDGKWWDSNKRIPDANLVLYRDYNLSEARWPALVEGSGLFLYLPNQLQGYLFSDLAELQLWPTSKNQLMPEKQYILMSDAQDLALLASKLTVDK